MGIEKQGSKSGGGYVGGFLQLFDWNGKSRKKLFAKSDLPEVSKQGKRNVGSLPTTRVRLIDEDENGGSSIRGSSDYSCASSVTDDDGNGTKAPGVVARLMGLDSLPTSSAVEPYSTPFFDTRSVRDSHSYRRSEFQSECQTMHSGSQPSMLDGFCRNPGESRFPKLQSRPIERFQTEMLPPKLAKSIPITHHKLLSPIKNPGFISSKNAAHIMEAAAKIIEPGPRPSSTKGKGLSLGSSSAPLKVRDLKEKMETAQRPSRLNGASRRPVESNAAKILKGQSLNKSWNGSEEPHRFRASSESEESNSVGSRNKGKSVSLAVQAKVNVQRREGFSSGGSRNLMSQKESQDLRSNQTQKSRSNSQKIMAKKTSIENASGVLRQNNQKQNCVMNRDKSVTKPSSNLQGRKTLLGDASFSRNKTLTKVTQNSKVGSKKISREMTDNEKEAPSLGTKSFPRKKRSLEGTYDFERGAVVQNVLVDKDERPIQHNTADSRRKGMDVVSFTFTSPMIRSTPGSQSSSPLVDKAKSFSIDSCDERANAGSKNTKLSSLGLNVIGGDALSILLDRKLRELTYGVESSCNSSVTSGTVSTSASILEDLVSALNAVGTTPKEHKKRSYLGLHSDKFGDPYGSNCSYTDVPKMDHKLQGVDEMDTFSSISCEARKELECQHPSPVSIGDLSFSNDSSNSSDTGDSSSTTVSKPCSFVQAQQVVDSKCPKNLSVMEYEMDISDSASSTFILTAGNESVEKLSMEDQTRSNKQEELGYIREIICNAELVFKDFMMGRTCEIINPSLFEQLEIQITWSRSDSGEKNSRQRRKVLFDCVKECLDLRCKQFVSGGCRKWGKGAAIFLNKGWLVEDIYKEISGWGSMGDWMMDELVDKDMSSHYGRWLDFEIEEFEEGVGIENSIVSSLIDEVVADILLVSR